MKKCNLCGKCRNFCAVFKVKRTETYSTRARLAVFEATKKSTDSLFACVLCGNCQKMCPFSIYVPEVVSELKLTTIANIERTDNPIFVNTTQVDSAFFDSNSFNAANFFEDFYSGNIGGVRKVVQAILEAKIAVFYDTTHKIFFEKLLHGSGIEFEDYISYIVEKDIVIANRLNRYRRIDEVIDYSFIPVQAYVTRHRDIALKVVKNSFKKSPNPNELYISAAIDAKVVALLSEAGVEAVEYTKRL